MAHASQPATSGDATTSAEMQQCIQECLDCYSICTTTAAHCLDMGGKHAARQHQTVMLDCATICATAADFMLRGSSMHARVCEVCAEICRTCEQECRKMAEGDRMMEQCADTCRRCAESCQRMATASA